MPLARNSPCLHDSPLKTLFDFNVSLLYKFSNLQGAIPKYCVTYCVTFNRILFYALASVSYLPEQQNFCFFIQRR